jgi:hypothetical protein
MNGGCAMTSKLREILSTLHEGYLLWASAIIGYPL